MPVTRHAQFLVRRASSACRCCFVISGARLPARARRARRTARRSTSRIRTSRPEDIERLRRALGLDRPLWQQYWSWLGAFVRGDWGYSFSDGRPVVERIARAPAARRSNWSACRIVVALALTIPAGIVVGRAARPLVRSPGQHGVRMAGISLPAFWFGLLLQMMFCDRPRLAALVRPDDAGRRRSSSITCSTC